MVPPAAQRKQPGSCMRTPPTILSRPLSSVPDRESRIDRTQKSSVANSQQRRGCPNIIRAHTKTYHAAHAVCAHPPEKQLKHELRRTPCMQHAHGTMRLTPPHAIMRASCPSSSLTFHGLPCRRPARIWDSPSLPSDAAHNSRKQNFS